MNKTTLKLTVLVLALLPILLSLGFWQLDRAEEKKAIQDLFEQRDSSPAIPVYEALQLNDLRHVKVTAQGHFLNQYQIYLDNRIYQSRFGYEIITPFLLSDQPVIVLVNRGWLAGDSSRRTLPEVPAIKGEMRISGQVYVPQGKMLALGELETTQAWPKVMQTIEPTQLVSEFEEKLFPYSVRLAEHDNALLTANWSVINVSPEKHTGYAVQWFAMAVALCVIYVVALYKIGIKKS